MLRTSLRTSWRPAGYPNIFNHLGDHLRAKRLDLGLQIQQLAARLDSDEGSVTCWEKGSCRPSLRKLPKILASIGYDPRPSALTLGGRLRKFRTALGLSTREFAGKLGVDQSTLEGWERGEQAPIDRFHRVIINLLRAEEKCPIGLAPQRRATDLLVHVVAHEQ